MLTTNTKPRQVDAVLRVDMLIKGEEFAAGDVVPFSNSDFKYLLHHDRVALATKENVAAVEAEVALKRQAAELLAARGDELAAAKTQLALALAELERLKKAK